MLRNNGWPWWCHKLVLQVTVAVVVVARSIVAGRVAVFIFAVVGFVTLVLFDSDALSIWLKLCQFTVLQFVIGPEGW